MKLFPHLLLGCHENLVQSAIELEQEYEMPREDDMAFFDPEIHVKDVGLEMPSDSIQCLSYNLDACVVVQMCSMN